MKKPIIGITCNLSHRQVGDFDGKFVVGNNEEYHYAIIKAGGIPILLPELPHSIHPRTQVDLCDGILLAGGDDINPLSYGEEPSKYLQSTDWRVDTYHLALTQYALQQQKPILGICRGMQLLNIACGGNVYQDVTLYPHDTIKHMQSSPRDQICHTVTTDEESIIHTLLGHQFLTNSFHHQVLHKLGKGLLATGWSKDRVIEAIEKTNHPFTIGVQWHPEIMLKTSTTMLPLFEKFITHCL